MSWQLPAHAATNNQAMTVSQAINVSKKTGRPIFAVAGANYCPACKKLLNTLNTDESLRPLLQQFVPLKINAQSQDYDRWKQFFPPERSAIPALFIVTPQGKQLFGKVGALPSKNLSKVMLTSLEKAGRYPTKEQWQEIGKTLESVEQAIQANKLEDALELLQPLLAGLAPIEPLLKLSDTGKKASQVVQQIAEKQRGVLKTALHQFASEGNLSTALQVARAEQLCLAFPQLKSFAKSEVKKGSAGAENRKLLRQASELYQAELLAKQEDSQRKAVRALQRVAKRYPNSEAASRAQQKLDDLGE
ncbi:MAG: thioredoxin family protein [Bythopirellula sp.]